MCQLPKVNQNTLRKKKNVKLTQKYNTYKKARRKYGKCETNRMARTKRVKMPKIKTSKGEMN